MLFPFGPKGLYTESIKSPVCSYIRHKSNIQQQMAIGGTRRYRTFILEFFRLALRPHKLSTHIKDKTFLNPLTIFTSSQFLIVATGIVYRFIYWCERWDLNPYALANMTPSKSHVCHSATFAYLTLFINVSRFFMTFLN